MSIQIRNVAIFAHVDAGKTSITEQLLYLGNAIRKPGSVDEGNTQTDTLKIEKERGISVCSSHASFTWGNSKINLIDTPGHIDFSADIERVIPAIDGAVMVISAVESIQPQTIAIWNILKKKGIPTIFFVNKIDRNGSNPDKIIKDITSELQTRPIVLQKVFKTETPEADIKSIWKENVISEVIAEEIASNDEKLLDAFFEGAIDFHIFNQSLKRQIINGETFPLLYGSAKYTIGIQELADAINDYLPAPLGEASEKLNAVVFGISYDKKLGRLSHLRVINGGIKIRETIKTVNAEEKILAILRLKHGKPEEVSEAGPGELIAVAGLSSTQIGDSIGIESSNNHEALFQKPLITIQVKAVNEKDYSRLAEALSLLNEENPALSFEWLKEEGEFHIRVMGKIQVEILQQIIQERFEIPCCFENPTVIYKETPAKISEGYIRYWMPKPCWAILKFRIEPGERGSGIIYESLVGVNEIAKKYQNEIERSIETSLKQGIKGWEVCDIRISLIEGEDHEMHSRPGDFIIATPMAIMDGLAKCGTTLLEPVIKFRIKADEELLGSIVSDITQMRGSFENPKIENGIFILTGELPLATSMEYSIKLNSKSRGKAFYQFTFGGYKACEDKDGVIRPYRGISPLETAKWILKARGAITLNM